MVVTAVEIVRILEEKKISLIMGVFEKEGLILGLDRLFSLILLLGLTVVVVQMIERRRHPVIEVYTADLDTVNGCQWQDNFSSLFCSKNCG
jgi:hypothetical protein